MRQDPLLGNTSNVTRAWIGPHSRSPVHALVDAVSVPLAILNVRDDGLSGDRCPAMCWNTVVLMALIIAPLSMVARKRTCSLVG